MTNPDPARITDPMWRLWTDRPNQAWKLGGIYADKKGYHNTVNANITNWPGNYSIRLPLDLVSINRDRARAIDLTMSTSEMIKWTTNMRNSAVDPKDHRLAAVKEFYGTLDGKTVFGLKKDDTFGPWTHSTADDSHLWHGHVSIFTIYVNNWTLLSPLIHVWSGFSVDDWITEMTLPKKGDTGEEVRYWQHIHNTVASHFSPPLKTVTADGDYGAATQAAIQSFWKAAGGTGTYDGSYLHGWTAVQYQAHFVRATQEVAPVQETPVTPEEIKKWVIDYLAANIPSKLSVAGELQGKVSFQ